MMLRAADDNVLPEIERVVERGILKLRFRQRFTSVNNARIRVILNAKAIESLAVAGSAASGSVPRPGAAPS